MTERVTPGHETRSCCTVYASYYTLFARHEQFSTFALIAVRACTRKKRSSRTVVPTSLCCCLGVLQTRTVHGPARRRAAATTLVRAWDAQTTLYVKPYACKRPCSGKISSEDGGREDHGYIVTRVFTLPPLPRSREIRT